MMLTFNRYLELNILHFTRLENYPLIQRLGIGIRTSIRKHLQCLATVRYI